MLPSDEAQLSYEDEIVRRFLGTRKMPTPYERQVLTRHGVRRCPDCNEWFQTKPREASLWDLCEQCENDRLGDVVAG